MNKSLRNNALLNAIKYACSILFPLITVPYITNVLGVVNYGRYTFATSFISYFTLVAQFGINTYATREGARKKNSNKFEEFVQEVFTINIISTFFSYLVLLLVLFTVPKLRADYSIILVLSLGIILNTLGADWINTIFEDYKYITIRYLCMQIVSLLLMLLFVKVSDDYLKYAFVSVIATAGGNLLNMYHIKKYTHIGITKKIRIKKHQDKKTYKSDVAFIYQ